MMILISLVHVTRSISLCGDEMFRSTIPQLFHGKSSRTERLSTRYQFEQTFSVSNTAIRNILPIITYTLPLL